MNETLTGKTRYRVSDYGFLTKRLFVILQVEIIWSDGPTDWHGMPEYLAGKGWRDAKPEDLQYLKQNDS